MKLNCGSIDRSVRVVLGLAGVGVALTGISIWGWLGLIPLATGGSGICLLYLPFGFSTRRAG